MSLTTHLKVGTSGAHSLWFILLIGIVFISSEEVRAHAPPRPMYYGHRVEPREPFKHIPSALVFGVDSTPTRDRLYDLMPTCGQLRNMWKSSLKKLNPNHINSNNNNNLDSNEIPVILNNPYYMAFLYGLQESRPHFGKIISKPTPATQTPIFEDRLPVHHKGVTQKNSVRETDGVPPIPGHFLEEPTKVNVVYGHVINSPEEAEVRRHPTTAENRHQYHESGRFGDFVAQADDSNESNSRSSDTINENSRKNERGTSRVKEVHTAGNGFSTADDFFKTGVWHDQPVIPSVSFQRFH